jgi:hypothetical protein
MSLYERHPFDPTPMFQGHPIPKERQHIWTCERLRPSFHSRDGANPFCQTPSPSWRSTIQR